jgi:hypothetical protein
VGLPSGTTLSLTPMRRLMCELLHASRRVPLVAIERTLAISDVIAARKQAHVRPSWFAIFLKAYAIVSERRPELRRSFLTFPWSRLHQHACNVAALAVPRTVNGDEGVLWYLIRRPERLPLAEIDTRIRAARNLPVDQITNYRRQLRVARLPGPLPHFMCWLGLSISGNWRAKFAGTFGITGIAALGSSSLSLLSPLTTTLTYGVFQPDGSVNVRLFYDHRVLDGIGPAAALEELESVLHGPIREELAGLTGERPDKLMEATPMRQWA